MWQPCPATATLELDAFKRASAVGDDEDGQEEVGQVMQRLIDADQPPEPAMALRHTEMRDTDALEPIDGDVDREVDQSQEPELGLYDGNEQRRQHAMDRAMRQQRQRPSGPLILAYRHPGVLQQEISDHMLDGEDEHPPDEPAQSNRRRHCRKQQADVPLTGHDRLARLAGPITRPIYDTPKPGMHAAEPKTHRFLQSQPGRENTAHVPLSR